MERSQRVVNAAEVRSLVSAGYQDWRELVRVAVSAYERIFSPAFYLRDLNSSRHIRQEESDAQVERVWKEFWEPIIVRAHEDAQEARPNVVVEAADISEAELEQIKLELYDMHNLMSMVTEVYFDLTFGRVSKPLTDPRVVVEMAEEHFREFAFRDVIEYIEVLRDAMIAETEGEETHGVTKLQVASWEEIIVGIRTQFLGEPEPVVDIEAEEVEDGPS